MNQTVNANLPIFHMPSMFLAALNGIRAQGYVPSIDMYTSPNYGHTVNGCVYKGPNGAKCAFGHCLPDSMYRSEFEGVEASSVLGRLEKSYSDAELYGDQASGAVVRLAADLQTAHDNTLRLSEAGPMDWERRMKTIATEFGFPELYTEPTPVPQPTTEGATM